MLKYYELATLSTIMFAAPKAAPDIESFATAPDARGELLGAWASDIGTLNQVFVLRGFQSLADMTAERERTRRSSDPFGCAALLTNLELESYAAFDFLPPVQTGDFGPFYEIRTYRMALGGLPPTEEKWREAVPVRTSYSPLIVAMHSIDGASRLTSIWSYNSLDERHAIRGKTVEDGIWPPKGGPDFLTSDMRSTIALPLKISPLK